MGLLNALHAFRGERVTSGQLAEEASHVEIEMLGEPIGKQDQYAAAFGGVNFFRFNPGGGVTVEPLRPGHGSLETLFSHLMMFWTGHQRNAGSRARGAEGEHEVQVRVAARDARPRP